MIPLIPPMVNRATMATAKSMAVRNWIFPPHMVASQLKIFTPVGMAMIMVLMVKKESAMGPSPVVNMWWLHTPQLMNPMSAPLNTMMASPKRGFRLNVGITSLAIPKAGRIRI